MVASNCFNGRAGSPPDDSVAQEAVLIAWLEGRVMSVSS